MTNYTKFTHAFAGIVTILSGFYAVSQQFRDWVAALAALYAAHVPTILQPIPPLAVALYMWYRNGQSDPNQQKAAPPSVGATTALLCILLLLVPFLFTGCSQSQIVSAVQKVEVGLTTVQGLLPAGNLLVTDLQQIDPEAAQLIGNFLQTANPELGKLIAASNTYLQNPGSDNYQALLNAVDAFTSVVDQQTLAFAGIKNGQSQTRALSWIALFSTGIHVTLTILDHYATSKQTKAVPAQSVRVRFDQIRPFLNRQYAAEQLTAMGYTNPDQLLAYAGM